jgi:RimJ/RimL family protein N-acetyltransferase
MILNVDKYIVFKQLELDINRNQIKCAVANTASRNIPQRLGFQLEDIERAG